MLKRGELEPGYSADGQKEASSEGTGTDEAGASKDEAPEA
jgi:hypothetical protein